MKNDTLNIQNLYDIYVDSAMSMIKSSMVDAVIEKELIKVDEMNTDAPVYRILNISEFISKVYNDIQFDMKKLYDEYSDFVMDEWNAGNFDMLYDDGWVEIENVDNDGMTYRRYTFDEFVENKLYQRSNQYYS